MNEQNKNNIEILDLSNDNNKKTKKNNKIIIIIFIVIAIFILLLPEITSFINNLNLFNNSTTQTNNNLNKNLYNGLIQIDIDSYMTVSDIKFYDFTKKANNSIDFNYISTKNNIDNIKDLNLSIGIYNKAQELIATYKFDASSINKGAVKTFKMNLSQANFIKATYAKVTTEQNNIKTSVNCIYDKTIDDVNLYYEIKYYFNDDKLYKYAVNKNILYTLKDSNDTLEQYKQELNTEYNSISKTNLTNITKEDMILKYTINLETFDKKESDYSLLYELNETKENILTKEENNGWVCE